VLPCEAVHATRKSRSRWGQQAARGRVSPKLQSPWTVLGSGALPASYHSGKGRPTAAPTCIIIIIIIIISSSSSSSSSGQQLVHHLAIQCGGITFHHSSADEVKELRVFICCHLCVTVCYCAEQTAPAAKGE
jgi:hypothetical protein